VGGGSLGLARVGVNVDPVWLSLIAVPLHGADDLIQVNEAERSFYRDAVHRADNDNSTTMSVDTHGLFGDVISQDGYLRIRMRLYRNGVVECGRRARRLRAPKMHPDSNLYKSLMTG